jgi:hypothetical protein
MEFPLTNEEHTAKNAFSAAAVSILGNYFIG